MLSSAALLGCVFWNVCSYSPRLVLRGFNSIKTRTVPTLHNIVLHGEWEALTADDLSAKCRGMCNSSPPAPELISRRIRQGQSPRLVLHRLEGSDTGTVGLPPSSCSSRAQVAVPQRGRCPPPPSWACITSSGRSKGVWSTLHCEQ